MNFVSRRGSEWTYRTYERGVEEETLACGSGSVAAAAMLIEWDGESDPVTLITRSGAPLPSASTAAYRSCTGEGRLVFHGRVRDVFPVDELPRLTVDL